MNTSLQKHQHNWEDSDNHVKCSVCGKEKLKLLDSDIEGIKLGIGNDGKTYKVRNDRSRFFYPNEWDKFYNQLRGKNKPVFWFLINTGCRIDECLSFQNKANQIDADRNTITLRKTKAKAAKGEKVGKPRTFKVSSNFIRTLNKYITNKGIPQDGYIFINTKTGMPWKQHTYLEVMKANLKKCGIADYYNFSLHNIRKTHGNWLKSLGVPADEICLRLGHDYATYLKHYGSANIFDRKDKVEMLKILGNDLYPQYFSTIQ